MASVADVIADLHRSCGAVAATDTSVLTPSELGQLVVAVGTIHDRLRAVHAVQVMEADRARVWHSSGARNVQSWLADKLATTYGEAVRTVKLGDVLDRSERVLRAVLAGMDQLRWRSDDSKVADSRPKATCIPGASTRDSFGASRSQPA